MHHQILWIVGKDTCFIIITKRTQSRNDSAMPEEAVRWLLSQCTIPRMFYDYR